MFQPKLRRAAASAALLCALSLLPANAAPAARSSQPARSLRSQRPAAAAPVETFWGFVNGVLSKFGVVIDPNGNRVNLRVDHVDPNGNDVSDPDSIR